MTDAVAPKTLPPRPMWYAVYAIGDGTPLSAMTERALQEACQEHARYRRWLANGTALADTQRHLT